MTTKRFFEIWTEVHIANKHLTMEDHVSIVRTIYEEEGRDRRTDKIGKKDTSVTEPQKKLLKDLGYANCDNLTKAEASDIITRLKGDRNK
jgi:hypothetical protein